MIPSAAPSVVSTPKHLAIVGATGAVGIEMLRVLERRNFPVASLRLLASSRSAGKSLEFRGEEITVEPLAENSFDGIDIALFSAGGGISKEFAPYAVKAGAVVIDNSSAFRMDPRVIWSDETKINRHYSDGRPSSPSGLWSQTDHRLKLSGSLRNRGTSH